MSVLYSLERRYPSDSQVVYYASLEIDADYRDKLGTKFSYVESSLKPTNSDFVAYIKSIAASAHCMSFVELNDTLVKELLARYAPLSTGSNPYFYYSLPVTHGAKEDFIVNRVLPGFIDYMVLKATIMHRSFEAKTIAPPFHISAMVQTEDTAPSGIVKFLGSSVGGKVSVYDSDGSVAEFPVPYVKLTSSPSIVATTKKVANVCAQANSKFQSIEREMTDRLNRSIKEVKETAFASMFRDANLLLEAGWKNISVTTPTDHVSIGEYLFYDQEIHPTGVSIRQSVITHRVIDDSTLIIMPLTKAMSDKMFVKDIYIRLGSTIHDAFCAGWYPHKDGNRSDRIGSLCVGDIIGKGIMNLVNLPQNLLIINYHSMYGNEATAAVKSMVHRWQKSYDENGILPTERKRNPGSTMFSVGTEFSGVEGDTAQAQVVEDEGSWD